nr:MAG TPA: hypothetical protein [Caudoviricetes sp.]
MKGYKAFDKGLVCRGKQYAENTAFEEDKAVICQKGMHFCAEPMDVFEYYPPESEFAEVEAPDEAATHDNRKYVTKKLKVGSKISLKELISAQIKIDIEKAKEEGNGSYAQGDKGHAAAQGKCGHAAAQGNEGHAAAQGEYGHAAAQGYKGYAAAQGYSGHAAVGGKDAIAAAFGVAGKAKACLGSWIMLAEWVNTSEGWHIKTVKAAKIDGEKLKADTWYMLKNGEFEEVKE